ncbi:MBG domain-containing protein, partial [Adlercreutzia sp. ZJ242]|uniref:MBG domain-containing protein n=1 Tax=Adlercreutzia sp. ZJ242 TaxID=2709409 RepID=UPI002714E4EA
TINPAPLTVTTPDASKTYDGTALTAEGAITGFVNDETATFATTGTQTAVGSSDNTYSLVWDGTAEESNYGISATLGRLTVSESSDEITVTTTGGVFTYDGQAHGATVAVSALPTGYTVETATSSAAATDVAEGAVAAKCDTLVIRNAAGEDVTSKLNIGYVDGSITINPAPLTVTTPDASKTYDGTALTAEGAITGFVNDETATFATTGTQTAVGSSDNTYSLVWDGTAEESNYGISATLGRLTVTASDISDAATFDVSNPSDTVYNGSEQREPVVVTNTVTGAVLVEDVDYTLSYSDDVTNVGAVAVTVTGIGGYSGVVDRSYQITPALVEVRALASTKVYSADDPVFAADVKGLIGFDAVTYAVTRPGAGADEAVGTYENAIVASGDELQGNYRVSYAPADFTISSSDALALAVTGYTGVYDGVAHGGFAVPSVSEGTLLEYSVDGGATWSEIAPAIINADEGPMTVQVRATNPNYWTATGSYVLSVTPAPVTITVSDASKVAGSADPTFTGAVSGLVAEDDLGEIAYSRIGDDEAVGAYAGVLTASFADNPNYSVTVVPGDFTITAAPVPEEPAPDTPSGTTPDDEEPGGTTPEGPTPGNPGGTTPGGTTPGGTTPGGTTPTPGGTTPGSILPVVPTPPTPAQIPGTVPDGAAAPVITPLVDALEGAAETVIGEDATPLADIGDEATPLAERHVSCWVHLYIILGIIVTLAYAACVAARRALFSHRLKKYEDDLADDDSSPSREPVRKGFGLGPIPMAPRGATATAFASQSK